MNDPTTTSAAYGALADCYQEADEHGEAEVFYRRGLVVDPAAVRLHVRLAETLIALNRPEEAEAHLRRALTLEPHSDDAMRELGSLLQEQGRIGEAVEAYSQAVRNGASSASHLDYAELLHEIGVLDAAERHYRLAARSPDSAADANTGLGMLLVQQGRPSAAERHLRSSAEAKPCPASLTNLANVLAELGRDDEAHLYYRAALVADPDCPEAVWGMAELLERRGDPSAPSLRARALSLLPSLVGTCRPS